MHSLLSSCFCIHKDLQQLSTPHPSYVFTVVLLNKRKRELFIYKQWNKMSLSFCLDQTTTYITIDTMADDAIISDGCYKMNSVVDSGGFRLPWHCEIFHLSNEYFLTFQRMLSTYLFDIIDGYMGMSFP